MNPDAKPAAKVLNFFNRIEFFFQKEAGRSLFAWALIALFNGLALIVAVTLSLQARRRSATG